MRNALDTAASPYLIQHKDNPVHWQTWGPEAFETAARHDKPVLLSVGYAACHWCHVMAHESFENADIAALMNELFVQRQGRPGGASGRRRHLPADVAASGPARRLAASPCS